MINSTSEPGRDAEKLSLMTLNAHKAGMQGLDTQKINQIIAEASKGSKFYQHKQKRYTSETVLALKLFCVPL